MVAECMDCKIAGLDCTELFMIASVSLLSDG